MPARHLMPLIVCASLFAVPVAVLAQEAADVPPKGGQRPDAVDGSATGRGVVHPPRHVDPGIAQAPPPPMAHGMDPMPVLRPPGATGGSPKIVPK